jgi:protein TonB
MRTIKRPEPKITEAKKPKLRDVFIDKKQDQEKIIETLFDPKDPEPIDPDFVNTIIEAPIEDVYIEDVHLNFVENVPVFPGCKGSNQELKNCFNKKIQKHFQRKFNSDLPNELGLSPGKKRVIMIFKIDKIGNIIDIMTKSPHPKLDKEAARIIKLLPIMKPCLQQGKPVGVKYTLPMRIDVD